MLTYLLLETIIGLIKGLSAIKIGLHGGEKDIFDLIVYLDAPLGLYIIL